MFARILFITIFLTALQQLAFTELKQPNIVFIFADDIGYEALNCYGGLDFETPHLNKMAAQGMLFKNMYTSPVCTPSRVSMHTGLYTFRHKHMGVLPVHQGTSKKVDFQSMPTYAQLLRGHGYHTAVTGKWQLATLEKWPLHIKDAGYDSWCVWQIWSEGKKTERHWGPCYNKDGQIMDGISNQFGPDVLTDYVLEQMEQSTKSNKPFFILHNELLPHWPVIDTPDDRRLKRTPTLKGMIHYMDKLVGRILNKVEELGIRDNTYVFFMGDNGTWEKDFKNPKFGEAGEGKSTRHTTFGNVEGGKAKLCDAGAHVPFLAWGPKSIPVKSINSELIDVVDLFPTFCELTQTSIPKTLHKDGRSIAQQIHGKSGPSREWTHQGWGAEENLFDGSWRYFIKKEKLWDARKLPKERKLTEVEMAERKGTVDSFKVLYKNIRNNDPAPPQPLKRY